MFIFKDVAIFQGKPKFPIAIRISCTSKSTARITQLCFFKKDMNFNQFCQEKCWNVLLRIFLTIVAFINEIQRTLQKMMCFLFEIQSYQIILLLYDLSSAFDTVSHKILLEKLQLYGFDDHAMKWTKSFLEDRQQIVSIDGKCSNTQNIYSLGLGK